VETIYTTLSCDGGDLSAVVNRLTTARNHGLVNIIRIDYRAGNPNLAVPVPLETALPAGIPEDWYDEQGGYDRLDWWSEDFVSCITRLQGLSEIYIVGNEPDLEHLNLYQDTDNGIPPDVYARAFQVLFRRVQSEKSAGTILPGIKLLAAVNAPFRRISWTRDMTTHLVQFGVNVDGFAIHTGGRRPNCLHPGSSCVWTPDWPLWDDGFRYYIALIDSIHGNFAQKPIYITEFNTFTGNGDEPIRNYHENWINEAFDEIERYNNNEGNHRIKALCWFVNEPRDNQWGDFALSNIGLAWEDMFQEFGACAPDLASRSADILDGNLPDNIITGFSKSVTIEVENTGSTTWTSDQGFTLGVELSGDIVVSDFGECGGIGIDTADAEVYLCPTDSVGDGDRYTFTFEITAPSVPDDSATISLSMLQDGVAFGEDQTWTIPVIGTNDAIILEAESDVPASIIRGTTQQVTISVENTGSRTWTIEDIHRLGAYTGNQLTWSNLTCGGTGSGTTSAQADLCSEFSSVEPGETHDFTFDITAPIALEPTTLSLCMLEDGEWFGEIQSWTIPVTCANTSIPVRNDRWRMQIYNNKTLSGDPVEWRYAYIGSGGFTSNFGGSRASDCAGNDNFSIRYRRNAYFSASDTYYFFTRTDDGVRLWVDGNLIINKWINQTPTSYTGSINLEAGWYDIRMEYYENNEDAYASLSWSDNKYPGCSCNNPGATNYCHHAPSTSGCPMTYPGGYCDPNGDGSYTDGNWDKGYWEWQDFCN